MRLGSGLLVCALVLAAGRASSAPAYEAGRQIRTTLRVTNTWVFCDEARYGSFVVGTVAGVRLWVKLPSKYRWLTATTIRGAKTLEFGGRVKGPRGDGFQVDEGEVHTVDGVSVGQMDIGLDWDYVEKTLFARDVTDAMRAARWERLEGREFAEVGRIVELNASRDKLTVKFREGTITWDAEVKLARPVAKAAVESYPKGAFVTVVGALAGFTKLNGAVTLAHGKVAVVPAKSGPGWAALR